MATSSQEVWDDKQNHWPCRVRGTRTPPSQDQRPDRSPGPAATRQPGRATDPLRQHRLPLPRRPPQLHGPYLIWTRKVDNKTVTRTLDTTQADALRPLMENSRRLRELTTELASLALQQVRDDPTQPDP